MMALTDAPDVQAALHRRAFQAALQPGADAGKLSNDTSSRAS
ncbi:Uncharacterised protein [Serratia rubidaea]|uniref:Uncharacterized protein n=1 Tax=Serratia rubidaea TaxID=61652 RepID=A0A447QRS8_SERRU|nr:Uncharacterised protein [Serratia rubidaea]